MSVEKINDCVVIPHRINWADKPKWRRTWATEISDGVNGAEDRSSGQSVAHQSIEYGLTVFSTEERARLTRRILAALKSGRAVVPFWPRTQYVTAWPALTLNPSGTNTFTVAGVTAGRWYYYEKGQLDTGLGLGFEGITITESGWFRPLIASGILLFSSGTGATRGRIYRADQVLQEVSVEGLWPWAVGQTAFFVRPLKPEPNVSHENRSDRINCGGSSATPWSADFGSSGGSVVTTGTAIDTSLVAVDPAPAAVYQSARNLSTASTSAEITYTFEGLQRGVPCRLRLHWAEIVAGFDGNTARRRFDVYFHGVTDQLLRNFEPYEAAGTLNKAVTICAVVEPDAAGTIVVRIKPAYASVKVATTTNVDLNTILYSIDGVDVTSGDRVLFKNQTNAQENGIRLVNIVPEGGPLEHIRATDCDHTLEIVGQVIEVQQGTQAGWFRNINFGEITLETDEIDYAAVVGNPLHAGINGIELHQFTWEARALSGVPTGKLQWSEWLKGVYPDGRIYPAFFGKPSVNEMEALTGKIGDLKLKIQEPLGTGSVAEPGACPVEVCFDDGPLTIPPSDWDGTGGPPGDDIRYLKIRYHNTGGDCTDTINSLTFAPLTQIGGIPVVCVAVWGPRTGSVGPGVFQTTLVIAVDQAFLDNAPGLADEAQSLSASHRTLNVETGACSNVATVNRGLTYDTIADLINTQIGATTHTGLATDPCLETQGPS